jgi:hypothetical protein
MAAISGCAQKEESTSCKPGNVSMTILVAYFFCTLTGKPQLWLTRYRRNRSNFDFFGRLVMLILRDQWGCPASSGPQSTSEACGATLQMWYTSVPVMKT